MSRPGIGTRTLVIAVVMSVVFVAVTPSLGLASGSPAGQTDSPDQELRGELTPTPVPTSLVAQTGAVPIAQAEPPGQGGAANNSAGSQSNETDRSQGNGTESPQTNGSNNSPSSGSDTSQSAGSDTAATGDSGQSQSNGADNSRSSGSDNSQSNGADNSQSNGADTSQSSGGPGSQNPPSEATRGTNGSPPDDTGTSNAESPETDRGRPTDPGAGNETPGRTPTERADDRAEWGPPEWVDSPGGPDANWTRGSPNSTERTVSVGGDNVTIRVGHGPPVDAPGHSAVAHVANATPNHPIPVALPAAANASIETRELSVTVSERRNVSLRVTTRTERDGNRTAEFTPGEAAEGLGYISVDHTVPNSDIETVDFRFTVAADRITPEQRGDIALYRYHNGSWNEVPTNYVDRNGTAYVFEAQSPGLSEFTVGKKVPSFEIVGATLLASPQTVADPVDVRVRITNDGGADGVYTARLLLNREPIAEKQLSIAAGGTRQASFQQDIAVPGEYTVLVNNYTVGDLDVNAATAEEGDGSRSIGTTIEGMTETIADPPSTMTEMPGFGIVAATMALLAAGLLRRRTGP